jgi:multiple sugar transport system ATP-binding protein
MDMSTPIEFKQVSKQFGATSVLNNITLSVHPGEFLVLVGPSGCGKSTLLRLLAGLETLSSGEIWLGDQCINTVSPKDRDIAMVFQNYALYPHMNVQDNLAFALKMRKTPKSVIAQRVNDAATLLELTPLLKRKPKELSGGQRQRVALGRAIVRHPKAFLMDEPLSNLDARLRLQMRYELAQLHQRLNTTTVYVTHDQVEALTLGQRIVVLNKGSIQQVDTPTEVYNRPANTFVANFIGQMNVLHGVVTAERTLNLPALGLTWPLPAEWAPMLTISQRLQLGFRPESATLSPMAGLPAASGYALPVQVVRFELLGHERHVYCQPLTPNAHPTVPDLALAPMVVRVPASQPVVVGDIHEVTLSSPALHWFDATTSLRLG